MKEKNIQTGANGERARVHNRQLVLGLILSAGTMGRAEMARASGLSTQAVSKIIAALEADGLLCQRGSRSTGRGLPATLYAVNPDGGYALGFEVRPDAVLGALLDLTGARIATAREVSIGVSPQDTAALVVAMRDKLIATAAIDPTRVMGAGVALPGPFGRTGLSAEASALPGWEGVDPVALIGDALDLPISVENDANAAAIAERIGAEAEGHETYGYLYFGAGLGLGLVSGGHLVTGAFGNAGEIGHLPLADGGLLLERAVSRLSLVARLEAAGVSAPDIDTLAALAQHEVVQSWIADAAAPLARAVHVVETLFDPETVILGGALPASILRDLVAAVRLTDASISNRPNRTAPRLTCGRTGRLVAAEGAAALVLNRLFTPRFAPVASALQ